MNIWLVNPFDPLPLRHRLRYSYLVSLLAAGGHQVTWWTSAFAHYGKHYLTRREIELENDALKPTARVVPTWTTPYRRHIGVARVINHLIWAHTFMGAARKSNEPPDAFFVSSPPLYAASLSLRMAKQYNAVSILDVVDLWPEAFEIAVPRVFRHATKVAFKPLLLLENSNFRNADAITAVSDTYRGLALSRCAGHKPSLTVPYGVDLHDWPGPKYDSSNGLKDKIRVCYAGTLGPQHDLCTILWAAKLLKGHQDIEFVIAGDGPDRVALESQARAMNLTNVRFTGWLAPADLRRILSSCSIGVAGVKEASIISVPMKVFEYWAAGLALVHSVKGELDELVNEKGVGAFYDAEDAESLADAIGRLAKDREGLIKMGKLARELVESEFDRKIIHHRLIDFISSLVCEHRARVSAKRRQTSDSNTGESSRILSDVVRPLSREK